MVTASAQAQSQHRQASPTSSILLRFDRGRTSPTSSACVPWHLSCHQTCFKILVLGSETCDKRIGLDESAGRAQHALPCDDIEASQRTSQTRKINDTYSMSDDQQGTRSLDLSGMPPIFVSRTHLTDQGLHELEDALEACGAVLTHDLAEAEVILSKATKKQRILFDLRAKGLVLQEIALPVYENDSIDQADVKGSLDAGDLAKSEVVLIDDSSTASEGEGEPRAANKLDSIAATRPAARVCIVTLQWFEESRAAGVVQPLHRYTTVIGDRMLSVSTGVSRLPHSLPSQNTQASKRFVIDFAAKLPDPSILQRAKEEANSSTGRFDRSFKRKHGLVSGPSANTSWSAEHSKAQHAHLLHATTSEEDRGFSNDLPEPPDWIKQGVKYACQRLTPSGSPNEDFISLLRKIKLARLLTSDEIGVRAYSTSIAALLAYPYKCISPREILRIPGCDTKIANLFVEWKNTGRLKAVDDIESDGDLKILRLFYDIWGVGSITAREFYYDRGWSDLDDLVEFNWKGLSRVQQVGVKFYEEFLEKIPGKEVEHIGDVVHRHAIKVRDDGIQSMIVGGYRRGKAESGDVDIIVSHPDESKTLNIISDIVTSLEEEGWITHTLLIALTSTHRDQKTLPFRSGPNHGGHGFDNLDKAFVVWQDPSWPTKEADLDVNPKAKNPGIHRRVDIIIAPWRTVGCAVLGWSGGTTFQRDIRRFVKHKYGWKFDSSGVRDRSNGEIIDLEGFHRYEGAIGVGEAKTMLQAEQRVFEGMGLDYVEPTKRCTD